MIKSVKKLIERLAIGQEGAAFSEYGMLLVLVVIGIGVAGTTMADSITTFLNNVGAFFVTQSP